MPDDPKKRGKQDRKRTSQQDHEQAYRKRKNASGDRGSSQNIISNKKNRSGDQRAGLESDDNIAQV